MVIGQDIFVTEPFFLLMKDVFIIFFGGELVVQFLELIGLLDGETSLA